MKIKNIIWERVDVECKSDEDFNITFEDTVIIAGEDSVPNNSVNIFETDALAEGRKTEKSKSALYAKSKIQSITSNSIVITAFAWKSKKEEFPVVIKGYF